MPAPAPSPPRKPDGLRALSVISEESSVASPVLQPRAGEARAVAANGMRLPASTVNGDLLDANGSLPIVDGDAPLANGQNHTLIPTPKDDSSAIENVGVNGTEPTINGGFRRSSSNSSIERQFARPQRAHTAGSMGSSELKRPEPISTPTPRGPSRKQTSKRFGSANNLSRDSLELEEEQYGVFAQKLISFLPKPRRVSTKPLHYAIFSLLTVTQLGSQGKFTLKDAITYFLRISRVWEVETTVNPITDLPRFEVL